VKLNLAHSAKEWLIWGGHICKNALAAFIHPSILGLLHSGSSSSRVVQNYKFVPIQSGAIFHCAGADRIWFHMRGVGCGVEGF